MRVSKEQKVVLDQLYTVKVVCDFCGAPHSPMSDITGFLISPGYGSSRDTEEYLLDICDRCLNTFLSGNEVKLIVSQS